MLRSAQVTKGTSQASNLALFRPSIIFARNRDERKVGSEMEKGKVLMRNELDLTNLEVRGPDQHATPKRLFATSATMSTS